VFIAFLEASKAFHRTNHNRLFAKPFKRNIPVCRGVRRLDGARERNKFGALMFEPKVFRKQMCSWRKYLRHFWDFSAPAAEVRWPHSDPMCRELCPPRYLLLCA